MLQGTMEEHALVLHLRSELQNERLVLHLVWRFELDWVCRQGSIAGLKNLDAFAFRFALSSRIPGYQHQCEPAALSS